MLRHHGQQSQRKLLADLRLVAQRERIENARNGLRSVVGVQRGKHQVAGFGGGQDHGDGFGIAHLAHQDHVRVLAQNAAQRAGEIGRVAADLDLLDDGVAVGVHELDRIFDGDDVIAAVGVDQVDQRGQRGAFSATGGAGDQHQALAGFGQLAQAGGEVQGFESGDFFRKQPEAARDGPALIVNVGAEAADAFAAETQIRGSVALQILGLGRSHQREQQMPRFLGAQRRTRGGGEHASDAQRHRSPGDQQEIGGSAANGVDQQGIERGKTFGSGQRRHIGRNRLASAGGGAIQFGDDFGKIFVETRHASKL